MASSAAEAAKRSAFGGAIFLNLTPYNTHKIHLTYAQEPRTKIRASFLQQDLTQVHASSCTINFHNKHGKQ